MKSRVFAVISPWVFFTGGMVAIGADATPPYHDVAGFDRFVKAASDYQSAVETIRGVARVELKRTPEGKYGANRSSLDFHRNKGNTLIERKLVNEKFPLVQHEFIHGRDPSGAYLLQRKPEGGSYFLKSFRPASELNGSSSSDILLYLDRFLLAPISPSSVPIDKLMTRTAFKPRGAIESADGSIRIDYDYTDPSSMYGSGWFEVSPRSGWLIGKASCTVGDARIGRTMMTTIEYGPAYLGSRVPTNVSIIVSSPASAEAAPTEHDRFDLDRFEADDWDASKFSPSRHGVPDLTRLAGGSSPSLSLIFFVLGILGVVVAVYLKTRGRRDRRQR